MDVRRLVTGTVVLVTVLATACFADRVVGPEESLLPAELALQRPTVHLFRYARGEKIESVTVSLTNNGQDSLGWVRQIGGVDYLPPSDATSPFRPGWLITTLTRQPDSAGAELWHLTLRPEYHPTKQDSPDHAQIFLKAENSPTLKQVDVFAQTLPGAHFEFSVDPMVFSAAVGPDAEAPIQELSVWNGGNGELLFGSEDMEVHYVPPGEGWLTVDSADATGPGLKLQFSAHPTELPDTIQTAIAYVVFDSLPGKETRAEPDSVEVQLKVTYPELALAPNNLIFNAIKGGESPKSQVVLLSNSIGDFDHLGEICLAETCPGDTTYSGSGGWFAGALAGERRDTLEIGVTLDSLTADMFGDDPSKADRFDIEVPVSSELGGKDTLRASLFVHHPILTLSHQSISLGMIEGTSNPPDTTVTLTNTGAGQFPDLGGITPPESDSAWLRADLGSDSSTVTLSFDAQDRLAGAYTEILDIQSEHGGTAALEVNLFVSRDVDEPVLALSASFVEFIGVRGDPSPGPQTVQISNAGGGSLGALSLGIPTYPGESGWLTPSLSPAQGIVTLAVATGNLPDGAHLANVPVWSASGDTASISVTFTVGYPVLTMATSVSFSDSVGGPSPPSQTVSLTNTGAGDFSSLGAISTGTPTYTGGASGWLSPSLSDSSLTLSATTGALGAGTYGATVPVHSAAGGSVSVAVAFAVTRNTDPAILVASPATVRMDALRLGADPPSQTVLLSNGGGGTLTGLGITGITWTSGTPGWLSPSIAGEAVILDASTGSMPPGDHEARVNLTSANGGNGWVNVTFVVGEPVLTLSANSASFSGTAGGGASPANVSVDFSNTGAGEFSSLGAISTLTPIYAGEDGWLSTALAGGNSRVDLSASVGALGPGTYTAGVPVQSAAGGSDTISVTLSVIPDPPDPDLVLSSNSVSFYAEEGGGDPAPQEISISNGGGGGLGALSLGAISAGWLSASPPGATVTLSATTGGLTSAGGPYSETVVVQSASGGNESLVVTFHISDPGDPADLEVSPAVVRMDAVAGGSDPADQEVLLYNGGGGALGGLSVVGITYGSGLGWLAAPRAGSTVTLEADVSGLAAGTYDATVEVSSGTGGNDFISVSLEVAGPQLTVSSTSASFSGEEGGSASPGSVLIDLSNTGAGTFASLGSVSIGDTTYVGDGGWLGVGLVDGDTRLELTTSLGSLGGGEYTAEVPVDSQNGGSDTTVVTLTVRPPADPPSLSTSASVLEFYAITGAPSPPPDTVVLSNSGGGTFGDLGLDPSDVTVLGGPVGWLPTPVLAGSDLAFAPSTGSLASGLHTEDVQVSSLHGTEQIEVRVTVLDPVLTASSPALSFKGLVDSGAPPVQPITFSNSGAGTYQHLGAVTVDAVTYGQGASGWLVSPRSGDTPSGDTLDFAVNLSGLQPGQYTAEVLVRSQHGGDELITLTLSVVRQTDPPFLALSTTSLRFQALNDGNQTNPPPQNVLILNEGGGFLENVVVGPKAQGADWLTYLVRDDTIKVSVVTGSLAGGTYEDSIPVSSSGGEGTIAVTFEVGSPRLTLTPEEVSFASTVGHTGVTDSVVVGLENTGGGTFSSLDTISVGAFTYADTTGWLQVEYSFPNTFLTVWAGKENLEARDTPYEASVPVIWGTTPKDTSYLTVKWTVADGEKEADLVLSLDTLTFPGIRGGEVPPEQTVRWSNAGGGHLGTISVDTVLYSGPTGQWLTHAAGPSATGSDSVLTLRPTTTGLLQNTPGDITFRATVVVESDQGGKDTLLVNLALDAPILELSTGSITFTDTVGASEPKRSSVFLKNIGAGNTGSLGSLWLESIHPPEDVDPQDCEEPWLTTFPAPGDTLQADSVGIRVSAADLPEGECKALIPVNTTWGGTDTIQVVLRVRTKDRSFADPVIELADLEVDAATGELVRDTLGRLVTGDPLPAESGVFVVSDTLLNGATHVLSVGVRKEFETVKPLYGLRVGAPFPASPSDTLPDWITGAFLEKTSVTHLDPALLVVAVEDLPAGNYEATLGVWSDAWEEEERRDKEKRLKVVLTIIDP